MLYIRKTQYFTDKEGNHRTWNSCSWRFLFSNDAFRIINSATADVNYQLVVSYHVVFLWYYGDEIFQADWVSSFSKITLKHPLEDSRLHFDSEMDDTRIRNSELLSINVESKRAYRRIILRFKIGNRFNYWTKFFAGLFENLLISISRTRLSFFFFGI